MRFIHSFDKRKIIESEKKTKEKKRKRNGSYRALIFRRQGAKGSSFLAKFEISLILITFFLFWNGQQRLRSEDRSEGTLTEEGLSIDLLDFFFSIEQIPASQDPAAWNVAPHSGATVDSPLPYLLSTYPSHLGTYPQLT